MVKIRVSTGNDVDTMCAITARNGLSLKADDWRNFWKSNPYHDVFRDVPVGWLLETEDGTAVGAAVNLHMMYDLDNKLVKVALGAGAAIDPPYRNRSVMLIGKACRQKEVDVFIVGSANPAVSQLLTVLSRRIPSPDSNVPLLWPVDHDAFAAAVLKRKKVPARGLLAMPVGMALRTVDMFRRKRRSGGLHVEVSHGFDDRFDALWEHVRRGPRRLRAVRTRANLEWRFQNELRKGTLTVVSVRNGMELCGYIVLIRGIRREFGLSVHEIADLQAPGDDPAIIKTLLIEALTVAKAENSGMVKFRAWNAAKRTVALELGPYHYESPLWQAYYSNSNAELTSLLATAQIWDFSPFEIF